MSLLINNQVTNLLDGKNTKSCLSQYLQGVQHFGITVDDMEKALEFYVGILGGKVAIGGNGFYGEDLQNLMFQKEQLEAIEKGINPKCIGVPNILNGTEEALDVRFISFGNTCIEVIHFRDAKLNYKAPNIFAKIPSSVGYANVPHISFHVKDDVDLNEFAKLLEAECQKRGLTEVVVNKIITVNSEAERKKAGLHYAKTVFPPGEFDGWALFYCKGPNGEQLEFNQVTRTTLVNFKRAQQEYNQEVGRDFVWASDAVQGSVSVNNSNGHWEWPHTKKWPKFSGSKIDILKQLFLAGEAMNINNFVQFFTEDAHYQFGNFPVVYGHQGIKDSSMAFLEKCEGLHHHLTNMWQMSEELVIVEMINTYVRHDGKIITLPCGDTVRFRGDKICDMRIYMDIAPLFSE
ncbi:nuclear transport factor 2 family protein [Phormidium sp. LEGE 05292]|uniref:nuclear transport factor 2 family protein n=1 Tax=[Phormidium] sp. LEGE 05292 TaxID=767427 RepID=UPI001880E29F|nr:nuclear transport factor 2 family protein [Phormidium sp. LEGE 05292]MBE9229231.1 nuclear transport factor 2 family protein [Phormidium sp. LEGE 05292]